jgi:hypothetical protein
LYAESIDHNQILGAYRAAMRGGIINSTVVVVPPGMALAYNLVPSSATYRCFYQAPYTVQPGATLSITAWLRKDAAMTYLPRVGIYDQLTDPLVDATAVALDEETMTDSINIWESFALSWQNTGTFPREVFLRAMAKGTANNVYAAWEITGGGAVKIASMLGRSRM